MADTPVATQFYPISTPKFDLYVASNQDPGAVYFVPEASEDEPELPEAPGMCQSKYIFMVSSGGFRFEGKEVPNRYFEWRAAPAVFSTRYRCKQKVTAIEPKSGVVCIRPKDNTFWERAAFACPDGETYVLPWRECQERYLVVIKGSATTDEGKTAPQLVPIKVPAREVTLTATGTLLAVEIWK